MMVTTPEPPEALEEDYFRQLAHHLGGPVLLAYLAADPPEGHASRIDGPSTDADVIRDRLGKWWNLDASPVLALAAYGEPDTRTIICSAYIHGVDRSNHDQTVLNLCWGMNAEGLLGRAVTADLLFQAPHRMPASRSRGRYLFHHDGQVLRPT